MSSKELIMDAVDKAYHGLPIEYHRRLGERLVCCTSDWCEDVVIKTLLEDIAYHAEKVRDIYHSQGNVKPP